ncbi:MAG: hypothetical protein WA228_06900, partial [Desulfobaccales bacterium]
GVIGSMLGCGQAKDNIFTEILGLSLKYKEFHPKDYASVPWAMQEVWCYFRFYNEGLRQRFMRTNSGLGNKN